ncbi:6518_t:CDS:2, partial [Diversispora eburnea]
NLPFLLQTSSYPQLFNSILYSALSKYITFILVSSDIFSGNLLTLVSGKDLLSPSLSTELQFEKPSNILFLFTISSKLEI